MASDSPTIRIDQEGLKPASMRSYWLLAVSCVAGGMVMFNWDMMLSAPDVMESAPGDLKRFISLSELFAHGFGIALIATGVWLLVAEKRRFIPRIVACAVWPALGVHLVKLCFGRMRPICYFDEDSQAHFPANIADTFIGWMPQDSLNTIYHHQSFPSAHTATAWGLAIGLSFVFPKGRALFYTLALFASIQRVSSFAHWPSDVCFGAAIGFVMAGALTQNWGLGGMLSQFEEKVIDRKETADNSTGSESHQFDRAA